LFACLDLEAQLSLAPTTAAVQSSAIRAIRNQTVMFTAQVSPVTPGSDLPTGIV
jgi:hypothetical protein